MQDPLLADLLTEQGRFMRTIAGEIVGDAHLAEDLAQEAWLRGRGRKLDPDRQLGWWRSVVGNLSRSLRLSNGQRVDRERRVARPERLPSTLDELAQAEALTHIAQAVQALPQPFRGAILMRYWEGLQPREIALRQDLPIATVKSQLQRGLQRLRRSLEDPGGNRLPALAALVPPKSSPSLLKAILLMQTNVKLLSAALVIGALGLWGLVGRSPRPEGARPDSLVSQQGSAEDLSSAALGEGRPDSDQLASSDANRSERSTSAAPASGSESVATMHLIGRVVDRNGQAVEEVRVVLDPTGREGSPIEALTGEEGRFAMPGVLAASYRLTAEAKGFAQLQTRLDLPHSEQHELADLVLDQGRTLAGWTLDMDGAAVPAAQVMLLEQLGPLQPVTKRLLGTTAADGGFVFQSLPLRPMRLGFLAPGFAPKLLQIPAPDLSSSKPLRVELRRGWNAEAEVRGAQQASGPLRLSALPVNDSPLANDEFDWVLHARRHWPWEAAGTQTIQGLVPGEFYHLRLQEGGPDGTWRTCAEVARVDEQEPQAQLTYQPTTLLGLTVKDSSTGQGIPGLQIALSEYGSRWRQARVHPPSDWIEPWLVETRLPGEQWLKLEASGYASRILGPLSIKAGQQNRLSPVRLDPTDTLECRVVEARSGLALEGVRIRTQVESKESDPQWGLAVLTDALGRARINLGPAGKTKLLVEHPGYSPALHVLGIDAGPQRIELLPGGTIWAHVFDTQGQAVAGIEVRRSGGDFEVGAPTRRHTDLEGRAQFSGLPPGEHGFRVVKQAMLGTRMMVGGSIAQVELTHDEEGQAEERVELAPGRDQEVSLVVPRRVILRGRVFEAGVALAGVQLGVIHREVGLETIATFQDSGKSQVISDAHGGFEFRDVPVGAVTLVARHPDRRFPFAMHLNIEDHASDVRLELPMARLSGIVRSSDGAPIEGALVEVSIRGPEGSFGSMPKVMTVDSAGIYSMTGGVAPGQSFFTDAEGRYQISHAPSEHVLAVQASSPRGIAKLETVKLGPTQERELNFELEAAGQLKVQIAMADGASPRNGFLTLQWQGSGQEPDQEALLGLRDSHRFEGLRPGSWKLTANLIDSPEKTATQDCEVQVGQAGSVTLTLQP